MKLYALLVAATMFFLPALSHGQAAEAEGRSFAPDKDAVGQYKNDAARFRAAVEKEDFDLSRQYHAALVGHMEDQLLRLEQRKTSCDGDLRARLQAESARMHNIYMAVGALTFAGSDPYPSARKLQSLIDEFGELLQKEYMESL